MFDGLSLSVGLSSHFIIGLLFSRSLLPSVKKVERAGEFRVRRKGGKNTRQIRCRHCVAMAGYFPIQLTKIGHVLHTKAHPHAYARTLALSLRPYNRHSKHMASITHLDLAYKRYPVNGISGLSSKLQVHHRTIGSDASVYACVTFQVQMCAYVSMDDLSSPKG